MCLFLSKCLQTVDLWEASVGNKSAGWMVLDITQHVSDCDYRRSRSLSNMYQFSSSQVDLSTYLHTYLIHTVTHHIRLVNVGEGCREMYLISRWNRWLLMAVCRRHASVRVCGPTAHVGLVVLRSWMPPALLLLLLLLLLLPGFFAPHTETSWELNVRGNKDLTLLSFSFSHSLSSSVYSPS